MPITSNLSSGRVTARYVLGVVDGPDPDDEPDLIPAVGTVKFAPKVPYLVNIASSPDPMIALPAEVAGVLDSEGYLCAPSPQDPSKPGKRGIRLFATDDPDGSVTGWTWEATPQLVTPAGVFLTGVIPTTSFSLPSGATLDLATLTKVPSSSGVGSNQAIMLIANLERRLEAGDFGAGGGTGSAGPKGDTGSAGPKGDKGDAGLKGDTGSAGPKGDKGDAGPKGDAGSPGSAGAAGPKGDKGDTGPQGPQGPQGPPGTGSGGITITQLPYIAWQADRTEAALRAAVNELLDSRNGATSQKVVRMQPGTTVVTSPDLVGSPTSGSSSAVFGLEIEGVGERMTTLAFNPAGGATEDPRQMNLFTLANRVRDFKLSKLKLTSNNPNANMIWAWSNTKVDGNSLYPEYGVGQNQRFLFKNVEWGGTWNRVIGIDGDVNTNNNSEWSFDHCTTDTTTQFTEAFLQSGGINGRNFPQMAQYLNFYVNNCNFTLLSGTFFRFIKGGAINVIGGSWSAANNSQPIIWFDMQGAGSDSAANVNVMGTRFEPKAANQLIMKNGVGAGSVTFRNVIDVSSLQQAATTPTAQYKLHQYTARNFRFPMIRYENCILAGSHQFTGANNGAPGGVTYDQSKFFQWTSNNGVASAAGATDGFVQWTGGKPRVRMVDCEGQPGINPDA